MSKAESKASDGLEVEISLGVLSRVEQNASVTQRALANNLGVALGIVNLYLKRYVKKGWVKATQVPANRYMYYLTPKGFQEKGRLTAEYLSSSLHFFRNAREQINDVFTDSVALGLNRIALVGVGDLAEIAILSAHSVDGIEVVGVIDETMAGKTFLGLSVTTSPAELDDVQGVVITTMDTPQTAYDTMVDALGRERVLAPQILHISALQGLPTGIGEA